MPTFPPLPPSFFFCPSAFPDQLVFLLPLSLPLSLSHSHTHTHSLFEWSWNWWVLLFYLLQRFVFVRSSRVKSSDFSLSLCFSHATVSMLIKDNEGPRMTFWRPCFPFHYLTLYFFLFLLNLYHLALSSWGYFCLLDCLFSRHITWPAAMRDQQSSWDLEFEILKFRQKDRNAYCQEISIRK